MKKQMKKALCIFGAAFNFISAYFLTFALCAAVFHAEHWSFLVAFIPAAITATATMWRYDRI